jgi:alkylation response protein AidB-like acyl-CoA dehydrogenase
MSTGAVAEIRGLARDFALAELRPHNERWDHDRTLDDDVIAKVADLGFFGMLLAEESGGMGFDLSSWTAALEELAWGEPAVALLVLHSAVVADVLGRAGADGELLSSLASGEVLGCIAFADGNEPVHATRAGDAFTLAGTKRWVSGADRAGVALVSARTAGGNALFSSTDVRAGARAGTLGLRPLFIGDADVGGPAHHVGEAPDDAADAGVLAALGTAAVAVGISAAALEHAVRYAAEREQFGRAIREFEGIQYKLAEMATRTAAARALVERAALLPGDVAAAAMAKLAAGGCAMFVTTEAVQVFGGYGYMRDYPVEKLMRDARAMELMNGSSELQRRRIAQSLYSE